MFGFTKGLVLFAFPQRRRPKVFWLTEICTHGWLQCTKKQTTGVSHLAIQRWAWKSEAGRPGLALVSKRSTFGLNVVLVLASSTLKWSERCAGASFISSKKKKNHKQVLTCTHPKLRWNCATSNNASKNHDQCKLWRASSKAPSQNSGTQPLFSCNFGQNNVTGIF